MGTTGKKEKGVRVGETPHTRSSMRGIGQRGRNRGRFLSPVNGRGSCHPPAAEPCGHAIFPLKNGGGRGSESAQQWGRGSRGAEGSRSAHPKRGAEGSRAEKRSASGRRWNCSGGERERGEQPPASRTLAPTAPLFRQAAASSGPPSAAGAGVLH